MRGAEKKRENDTAILTDLSERWGFTGPLAQKYTAQKKLREH